MADSVFGAWERSFAPEERGLDYRRAKELFAAFRARGSGDDAGASAAFSRLYTEIMPCAPVCVFSGEFGRSLEAAGRADEAIQQYEAHLTGVPLSWHAYVAPWTPLVLERLGALYEAKGDVEKARATYQRMAEQYADADGPLAERARQARQKAAALAAPR
jgi:tetratricopeptide (TPR) repeat protein